MDELSPDFEDFDASVEWWRSLDLITDEQWRRLEDGARARALAIAGVAQLDLVDDVWSALERAIRDGETLEDFRARVGDRLKAAWGGDKPWQLESLFRTSVQRAYSAGRYLQMTRPEVKRHRPYWKFIATLDQRTCLICSPLNGTVLPADSGFFQTHVPPLHGSCRCTVISLSAEEADDDGIDDVPESQEPQDGFGGPPMDDGSEPDLLDYPEPLVAAYKTRG